jgi:hypothetical protein
MLITFAELQFKGGDGKFPEIFSGGNFPETFPMMFAHRFFTCLFFTVLFMFGDIFYRIICAFIVLSMFWEFPEIFITTQRYLRKVQILPALLDIMINIIYLSFSTGSCPDQFKFRSINPRLACC